MLATSTSPHPEAKEAWTTIEPNAVLGPVQLRRVLHQRSDYTLYEGEYLRLGAVVGVYVLPGLPPDEHLRFLCEALGACTLHHPTLVRTIDFGDHEGVRYLVTERLHGTTLEDSLATSVAPLPERVILKLLSCVSEVLVACHSQGLAHRDLCPSALQVDRRGRFRMTALGLAPTTLPSEPEPPGSMRWAYRPPEYTVPGTRVDTSVDLYAIGVIAYRLAFQRLPYCRPPDPFACQTFRPKGPPFALPTHCSPALLRVIRRLIDPDPNRRITSATTLLEELPTPAEPPEGRRARSAVLRLGGSEHVGRVQSMSRAGSRSAPMRPGARAQARRSKSAWRILLILVIGLICLHV